jgi:hypothetical protein
MPYRYTTEQQDYTNYSSGRVFYGMPGHPALPVRLASEILQRCVAIRQRSGATGPCVLYDPCCGGAYHLSTLAYLHWDAIAEIIGSDISAEALSLAERNLALLTIEGLDRRIDEIRQALAAYRKISHVEALNSAQRLKDRLLAWATTHPIRTHLFRANALDGSALEKGLGGRVIDVVITDVPYGQRSDWQGYDRGTASPTWQMLEAMQGVVSPRTVLAVVADKGQKIAHGRYEQVERFRLGKRQVVLLKPMDAQAH